MCSVTSDAIWQIKLKKYHGASLRCTAKKMGRINFGENWERRPRHDLDLWPLTLKIFTALPTYVTNIRGKFHWNLSTKYRDIGSRAIGVLSPPFGGGLGPTYDVHFRLIGKRVVNFLLMLIKLFARCYGSGATSEYRLKIGVFAPTGSAWPKLSGRRGRFPSNILLVRKLGWMILHVVKNVGTCFFRFVTNHAFDRRTDGQLSHG